MYNINSAALGSVRVYVGIVMIKRDLTIKYGRRCVTPENDSLPLIVFQRRYHVMDVTENWLFNNVDYLYSRAELYELCT